MMADDLETEGSKAGQGEAAKKTLAILGATGLVGQRLYQAVAQDTQFQPVLVGRTLSKLRKTFPDAERLMDWSAFNASKATDYHVLVNLAGASASGFLWTPNYRNTMTQSRVRTTQYCVDKCQQNPDIHLINASAVSAYGLYSEGSMRFTEDNQSQRSGRSFLQTLADQWEQTALQAKAFGCSVTLLRIGVVLAMKGGALAQMIRPYRFYLGGPVGSGRQMLSWVALDDLVSMICFLLSQPSLTGPINCTAPGSCTNAVFSAALAAALRRPNAVRLPGLVVRGLMGQMGEELLLKGQQVYPQRLLDAGFKFKHPEICPCLNALINA